MSLPDWSEKSVVVAGLDVWGYAAADALIQAGAQVTVIDDTADRSDSETRERATILEILEATVRLGPGSADDLPPGTHLVVVSPDLDADLPLLRAAAGAGIDVISETELAWRLRDPATPWLVVTGASGSATTVRLLGEMLRASGLRAAVVGGAEPVLTAILDPTGHDVIVVEMPPGQLRLTTTMSARSAVVLNAGGGGADWGQVYAGVETACVYNVADPATEQMVRDADVTDGARAIGFTLEIPRVGMLGIVDDVLVDRAFIAERQTSAAELATVADVVPDLGADLGAGTPAEQARLEYALAASALARSLGVPPVAVRDGLRAAR